MWTSALEHLCIEKWKYYNFFINRITYSSKIWRYDSRAVLRDGSSGANAPVNFWTCVFEPLKFRKFGNISKVFTEIFKKKPDHCDQNSLF